MDAVLPPTIITPNDDNNSESEMEGHARRLSAIVARDVFNTPELYPDQLRVLERLAMMKFKLSSIHPAPILFVQPTGGGKSMVRDVHSVISRGISLTIVPVLSLGADQRKKVIDKANQSCGRIISIHIDEITNTVSAIDIIKNILLLPDDTKKTILLFASPQAIVDKPHWKQFLKELIKRNLLRLVAVDEIQLFVHYGLSFRHQFAMLSTTLFKDLKVGKTKTKIPVLFMTATCTVQMFEQLQTLTGLTFQKDKLNVFWPDSVSMQKRNIYTRVMYTNRVLQVFTSQVDPILSVSKVKSFIFYANTRAMIDRVSEKYGDWLDRSTHQSDYLKLTGTMKKKRYLTLGEIGRVKYLLT